MEKTRYDAILAMLTEEEREHLQKIYLIADAMFDPDDPEQEAAVQWFGELLESDQ